MARRPLVPATVSTRPVMKLAGAVTLNSRSLTSSVPVDLWKKATSFSFGAPATSC